MARYKMYVSSEKARRELGYNPGPAEKALREAVEYFRHEWQPGFGPGPDLQFARETDLNRMAAKTKRKQANGNSERDRPRSTERRADAGRGISRPIRSFRWKMVPVPEISEGEILVRVHACGVCGTDLKKIEYGLVPPPRIFGHEFAGTVVEDGIQGNASSRWETAWRRITTSPAGNVFIAGRSSFHNASFTDARAPPQDSNRPAEDSPNTFG